MLGVTVCGLAGIYCAEAGCGGLEKAGYPQMWGQSWVLLVGLSGLVFSLLFLGCRCLPLSRNWFGYLSDPQSERRRSEHTLEWNET